MPIAKTNQQTTRSGQQIQVGPAGRNRQEIERQKEEERLRRASVQTSVRTEQPSPTTTGGLTVGPAGNGRKRTRAERAAAGVRTAIRTPEVIPSRAPRSGIIVTRPELTGENEIGKI